MWVDGRAEGQGAEENDSSSKPGVIIVQQDGVALR
jgi:hypothetical protein